MIVVSLTALVVALFAALGTVAAFFFTRRLRGDLMVANLRIDRARANVMTALQTLMTMERSFDVEFAELALAEALGVLGGKAEEVEADTLERWLAHAVHAIKAREAQLEREASL